MSTAHENVVAHQNHQLKLSLSLKWTLREECGKLRWMVM